MIAQSTNDTWGLGWETRLNPEGSDIAQPQYPRYTGMLKDVVKDFRRALRSTELSESNMFRIQWWYEGQKVRFTHPVDFPGYDRLPEGECLSAEQFIKTIDRNSRK